MKIGFDAKRIVNNATGLGNYSRYIVNAFLEYYPANNYLLYAPSRGNESLRQRIIDPQNISYHLPSSLLDRKLKARWRSYSIVNDLIADKVDLFHGLSNEIPFTLQKKGIPSLVTVHDLIFRTMPDCYHLWDRWIYNYKYQKSAQLADKVIAISECTKKDMVELWKIPENKIEVIYQDCDESFMHSISDSKKEEIIQKYNIKKPYILYVGSIEKRKNLLLLIKAVKEIKEDIEIIAIGKRTPYADRIDSYIKEKDLQSKVRLFHNVPFADLPGMYQLSELLVYPSFYEGFGLPIVEALHSGIPVIGATGSCLEEAGGPDSLYTDPNKPEELAYLINSVLLNPSLSTRMRTKGKEYVKRFNKKDMTDSLFSLYKTIV